ncbi:YadA-like family protein, partial [Halomonas sp. 111]
HTIHDAIDSVNTAANAGWNVTDVDGNAANIGPNGEVQFSGDSNIGVAQNGLDGNGEIDITLNRDLDLDSVTTGDSTLSTDGLVVNGNTGNPTATTTVEAGTITVAANPATGPANEIVIEANSGTISGLMNRSFDSDNIVSGQAATEDQLGQVATDLTNTGFNIAADNGADDNVRLGETVTYTNDDGNLVSTVRDNEIVYDLANNINVDSITAGDSLLDNDGLTVDDGSGNTTVVSAEGTNVTDTAGNNSVYGATGATITDAAGNASTLTGDSLTVGGANPILVSGSAGEITGLTNTTYDENNVIADRAASEGQLSQVATDLTNTGFNIAADNGTDDNVRLGETVTYTNDDGNLVSTVRDNEIVYDLADSIAIDQVTTGDTVMNDNGVSVGADVQLSDTGLAIGDVNSNDPSTSVEAGTITLAANPTTSPANEIVIDANSGTVSGLANRDLNGADFAQAGRAATEEQLNIVNDAATAGWNVTDANGNAANIGPNGNVAFTGDSNIAVAQTGFDDNGEVEITLNRDLDLDSVTTGNTVVNNDGLTINDGAGNLTTVTNDGLTIAGGPSITASGGIDAGGMNIANVADGELSENSADAINGSQLYATNQWIENLQGNFVNIVGDSADEYITQNGRGIRYVRTNDSGLAVSDAFAQGVGSTALGYEARATADQALAMGYEAVAAHQGSVALGAGAQTSEAVGTASIEIAGQTYQFAGANPVATVSVGSAGAERTITNVAAGRISAESTDAVNGSQLHATNQAVGDLDNRVTTVEGDISNINNDLADLDSRAVQYDRNDDGSVDYATITLEGEDGTTITNVANGDVSRGSSDAVNGGQLWDVQNQITSIEQGGSKYFRANSEGPAADSQGVDSIAMGPSSVAEGDRSVASGAGSRAEAEGSVALGADSIADREGMNGERERFSNESVASSQGAVSVGSEGAERQITNIAGGTQATDAVNVRQLDAVQQGAVNYARDDEGNVDYSTITLRGEEGTTISNVAPGVNANDAVNVGQMQSLNQRFANEINNVHGRIDNVERNANAGAASALAASTVPQAWMPGKSMVGVGAGTYEGESAVSVGVSRLSDNGRWIIQGKVTGDSQSNFGAGIGAGWHW